MGLGLTRPELALIPISVILLWLAIEGILLFWALKVAGRAAARQGHWTRLRRSLRTEEQETQLMRVCQWCHGKGTLHAHLGVTLGLISSGDSYEPECPNCQGAGYLAVPVNKRRRKALRRRLMRQEWTE